MYQTPVGGSRSPENAPSASPEGGGGKKQQSGQQRIRRRNRLITSCLECRRRKLKCDKGHPCTNCTRFSRDCVFLAPALDPQAQLKLAEIKEKMGTLERTLEEDVARRQSNSGMEKERGSGLPGQDLDDDSDGGPTPDDEKDLEPTPFALSDVAYDEDVDDDMVDLGIQIGKMRITERLGGFVRPKMTDEVSLESEVPVFMNLTYQHSSNKDWPNCLPKACWTRLCGLEEEEHPFQNLISSRHSGLVVISWLLQAVSSLHRTRGSHL